MLEFVLGTVDIIERISCQPVQFVQLLGLSMRSVGWREDERRTDDTRVLRVGALEIGGGVGEVLRGAYLQPFGDMPSGVDRKTVAFVAGILDNTRLVGVGAGEGVVAFVGAAGDCGIVLLRPTKLVNLLLPVGTGYLIHVSVLVGAETGVEKVLRRGVVLALGIDIAGTDIRIIPFAAIGVTLRTAFVSAAVRCRFVLIEGVMVRIEHLYLAANLLYRTFDIQFYARSAFLPFAGSNDHHAVGAA